MLGYNGAAFISDGEREEIDNIIKRFKERTDIPIKVEISTFECGDLYEPSLQGKQTGYIINGNEFRKSPCTETWSGYVNRIKSYLFNILIA